MATSDPSAPGALRDTAERIKRNRERILARWEDRARREIAAASREPHPILIDTLPALLDDLVEALADPSRRRLVNEGSTVCQEHGGERARVTQWGLEDLLHEYQILREVVLAVMREEGPVTDEEYGRVHNEIDEVMKDAATAFGLVERTIREQFFATLAHDLRGPLAAAYTAANLILKYVDRPEQHPRLASRIVQNLDRIEQMVTDLLDTARIRAGERLALKLAECSVDEIARDVVDELSVARGVEIHLEAEPTTGFWDAGALTRVLENLLINAIKYGDTARPITVSIAQKHGRTLIHVHNEGRPIPAEDQETLFNAYRRARQVERDGPRGWGLGLALVRGVAEAHGGSVMLDSAQERGTTFTVDIPTDARPFQATARRPFD